MKNTNNNRYAYLLASLSVAALLLPAPASAQDTTAEIDKLFSWAMPSTPGCAVAASHNGEVVVNRAYGLADLERGAPITPGSVFDIGSTQKQFVAAAVLLLAEDGRLSLADDVRKYIPELPDTGHTITVDHLLTHTSGIRDWTGLMMLAEGEPDALTLILRQRGLNFAPGEEWAYSNSGYVLAKEIVARSSGMSFVEFARTRLFEPLGMKSTAYLTDMRAVVKNRALAYDQQGGRWRMAMLLDNERGGGGLFSTTGDLLIWNHALTNKLLGAFVSEKIQEAATLNNGRKLDYARGLLLDSNRGGRVLWHGGSADGYKSLLSRYPEQGLSIAILCNSGDDTVRTEVAGRIFDLLAPASIGSRPEPSAPAATAEGVDPAGLDLSSKAGLFFSEGAGEPLRLAVQRGRLRVVAGPALVALSNDRFRRTGASLSFLSQDEFELHFLSPDQFDLKSMEGNKTRYRRAQPYAPAAADLETFAGRYENDEIGTVFQVEPKGEGLLVRLEHAPSRSLNLRPVAPDTFQIARMTFRFQRDPSGKAVALDYSNPVVRNLRFTRLSDR